MYISVKVITNAAKDGIIPKSKGEFIVKVTATPERGKANKKMIQLLADYFKAGKSDIVIVKGKYNSRKIIHIC